MEIPSAYQIANGNRLKPETRVDTTSIGELTFTFQGVRDVPGPNYRAAQGLVVVTRNGREIAQLRPEKRIYRVQTNPMTEAPRTLISNR